ncbi:hypothetical protein ACFL20_04700 [Spirochaetota bacterium]
MKKFGPAGNRYLKMIHIFFISLWVGGGFALVLLFYISNPGGGDEIYATYAAMKIIDDFIIIPGAMGNLITGLVYGIWTKWGFFKHWWVTVKWIMTVLQILFGTFFLGPWLNNNTALADLKRIAVLKNPDFLYNNSMTGIWGPVQVAMLLVMIIISVKKPWRKLKSQKP